MGCERLCAHVCRASDAIGSACGPVWTTSDADHWPGGVHVLASLLCGLLRRQRWSSTLCARYRAWVLRSSLAPRLRCSGTRSRARNEPRRSDSGERSSASPSPWASASSAWPDHVDARLALRVFQSISPSGCRAHLACGRRHRRVCGIRTRRDSDVVGHVVVWRPDCFFSYGR